MGVVLMAEPKKELMIRFDPEKCTQCHGCEIACKTWRELDYGVRYRRVLGAVPVRHFVDPG